MIGGKVGDDRLHDRAGQGGQEGRAVAPAWMCACVCASSVMIGVCVFARSRRRERTYSRDPYLRIGQSARERPLSREGVSAFPLSREPFSCVGGFWLFPHVSPLARGWPVSTKHSRERTSLDTSGERH